MPDSNLLEVQPLAAHEPQGNARPFLTVAIPHYKQRPYLEIVLASIFEQTYADFEILISDDRSPDDSNSVIPPLLKESGRAFRYYAQEKNLGYDGNVRFCLRAARGQYVFLLGNDDALKTPETLADVVAALQELQLPEIAFTNYEDWATGVPVNRAQATRVLGGGAQTAARYFRTFSFVSGLIYKQELASAHETGKWDQSIYYQIYLASRILAAGGHLGALSLSAVRKDVRFAGKGVPTFIERQANQPWSFQSRSTGLDSVIRVTADAILPTLPEDERSKTLRRIVAQVYAITYPYWLFEYRRAVNWSYAVGIARNLWPGTLLADYDLKFFDALRLWLLYLAVTIVRLGEFVRERRQSQSVVESL